MVRFCPGAEGGRIADVVFELGAGKAFVANHYLPGREGAFDSAATARSSALSGASSTPTGSPSGELEEVEAEAALDSGGSRAEATSGVFHRVHRIHSGSTSRANAFTLVRPSLTGDLDRHT